MNNHKGFYDKSRLEEDMKTIYLSMDYLFGTRKTIYAESLIADM